MILTGIFLWLTIVAPFNQTMPAISGAAARQWTTPGLPTCHEASVDSPATVTVTVPAGWVGWVSFRREGQEQRTFRLGGRDWNGDGSVDSQDVFDFLRDFYNGHAEFNGDWRADSADWFDWYRAWSGQ